MASHQPPFFSAGKRYSLLGAASPLSYGVAAVIVFTVGYSAYHFVPLLRRDLQLLRAVSEVDQPGIRLAGELKNEIELNRSSTLSALLSDGATETREVAAQSLRTNDLRVQQTESQIAALGSVPESSFKNFDQEWTAYVAARNQMLAGSAASGRDRQKSIEASLGSGGLLRVEQAVQDAVQGIQGAFAASSAAKAGEVSHTLESMLRELYLVVLLKILVLGMLVWTDWKRIRAERLLQRVSGDLQFTQERFRHAYEAATVGMGLFKLDGTVLSVNAKGAEILGYEVSELIGMKVSQIMAPEHVDDHLQRLVMTPLSKETSYRAERRVLRKDGREAWVRNSVTLFKPEGQEPYYFSTSEEITLERKANDRLTYLANYDPVTNLPNRRCFEEQLGAALEACEGKPNGVALLYLEIDSFDFLKGTFGRNVADDVLSEIGNGLGSLRRPGEILARLDDDVFGMLMPATPFDETTQVRAAELREFFHGASETGRHRIPLSASIGIAYSGDGCVDCNAETLLKFARAAMLEARSRGGDSIFLADPALQERAEERHQIELALLRGLRSNEFSVVFQPQFEVATGRLMRFEALCRWESQELGAIPPDRFIPIAEQTGLIMEIGRRILHEALRQAKRWIDSGRRIGIAVNISPMQFMRPDFTQSIGEVLMQLNFPPELVELEITEGIFIRDLNLAVGRLRELQRLGLSIALDDFGTGYSSLSYLQRMPIDAVKLDRSFVSDLTTDSATVSMVRSVLAMAEALNLRVVTEGVETEQQLEILRSLGCDEAQGYLLGRPESAELALKRVLESPAHAIRSLAG